MKSRFLSIVFVFLLVFAGFYTISAQCDCAYVTPDSSYVEIVFVGKVSNITEVEKANKYQVQISEIFKGLGEQKTIDVFDSFYNCSDQRHLNKEYLFMNSRDKQTGKIHVVGCSYSYKNKYQQKQMIEILRWKKSANQGGILVGKVTQFVDDEGNSQKPDSVDKVFVESEKGEKFEANIESDGFYKVENLKAGRYKVFLNLPKTLITYGDKHDFDGEKSIRYLDLSKNGGEIADFSISVNGIISGKVLDSNGKPVSSINVNLLRLEESETDEEDNIETDKSGNFIFKGLSAGKYLINVGAEDWYVEPNSKEAIYPKTFFPNKNSQKEAKVIQLDKAQVLKDQNITLLPILKKRILSGKVLMPNGQPAINADVTVQIKRKDVGKTLISGWYVMTNTDSNGNFLLDVYEETEYLIKFDVDKPLDDVRVEVLFSSKCFVLPKNGIIKPLKITLKKGDIECNEEEFGF
jgi:5-hydroxyisourate hydrolase-like protein (transthyretin family)